jgi:hypothetical protein
LIFFLFSQIVLLQLLIMKLFHLVPGGQTRLLAAKGLQNEDKVNLVAHVVRQNRGVSFLPKYKYALDGVNGTVYVLVLDVEETQLMAGRSFKLEGEEMSFYRVLNIEQRSAGDDIYQSGYVDKIWPPHAV